jgi:hypothetical protein
LILDYFSRNGTPILRHELSKTGKEHDPLTPPTAEEDDPPTMTLPSVAAVARDESEKDESIDSSPTMTLQQTTSYHTLWVPKLAEPQLSA